MMVLLRAFVLVVVGVAIAAGYRQWVAGPIVWTLEANPPLEQPGDAGTQPPADVPDPQDSDPAPGEGVEPGDDEPAGDEVANDPAPATPSEGTKAPKDLTYADLGLEIGLDGAVLLHEMAMEGRASIVDARRPEDYRLGHIPMAFNLTPASFRFAIPDEIQYMAMDAPVMLYCTGGDCEDSHIVGQKLREIGFQRLHILMDGFDAWQDAGYDVVTGDQP